MDRIFLDANVLFSAAYLPNAGLTRLWQLDEVELMTSDYAAQEATLNLSDKDQRVRLAKLLKNVRVITTVAPLPPGVQLPEKDRPILQAAVEARATHLLTGDKEHFGPYFGRNLGGVLILPPAMYFERREKEKRP